MSLLLAEDFCGGSIAEVHASGIDRGAEMGYAIRRSHQADQGQELPSSITGLWGRDCDGGDKLSFKNKIPLPLTVYRFFVNIISCCLCADGIHPHQQVDARLKYVCQCRQKRDVRVRLARFP